MSDRETAFRTHRGADGNETVTVNRWDPRLDVSTYLLEPKNRNQRYIRFRDGLLRFRVANSRALYRFDGASDRVGVRRFALVEGWVVR